MKKVFLIMVCVCITAFAHGTDFKMSVGGGLFFGLINSIDCEMVQEENIAGSTLRTKTEMHNSGSTIGAFFFFDATYAEVNLAYINGPTQANFYGLAELDGVATGGTSGNAYGSFDALEIGLLGKYPFQLGQRWRLFPLLGINYLFVFSAISEGVTADKPQELSRLGFQGGVGADFAITESIFIRGEFLWCIWMSNQSERDAFKNGSVSTGDGPRFKLAGGYTFGQR